MEDITDVDYRHARRVFKNFNNKNLGDYHDLYDQSDTLFLKLLTDIDGLLMVEKGIRGEICHAIGRYVNANDKYMKNYDKNKESSYIQYLDANNL